MKIGVFLDRDGTLIKDSGYISSPDDVHVLPGVFEGLQLFKQNNYQLHIISNQSGLNRGKFSKDEFDAVEARVNLLFNERGIIFDSLNYCFHQPSDGCSCRKPKTGLLQQVALTNGIEKSFAVMIGNSEVDRGAADSFGIRYWDVSDSAPAYQSYNSFPLVVSQIVKHFESILHELE